ncbi:phosphatase PAP2 family protein [Flavobacterium sp. MAH-1]|uniref:Phosphatase PAP2 family protein n=1 Tax=Flavobacterium agri TaxID=2743471 RepID=A0A7Y8Y152_9FLAO|nr:phosphatase PAP2 family protein [Flavobacterium agri]NUY80665.1 phosphatase PAP2 family protein [Flavobacterium agri]NYA70689.1 phosphatase PAP2 family protein [Flavobacterium agri]
MARIFSFLLVALFAQSVFAQDSSMVAVDSLKPRPSIWADLKYDGASVYKGVLHAYSEPAHWGKDEWTTAACLGASTTMLWLGDEEVGEYFLDQGKQAPGFLKEGAFYFGKPLYNYGITGGIYAFGLLTRNQKVRKTGVLLISSATAGGLIQTVLKNAVGRARPGTGRGSASFKPFSKEEGYHSFPSGHTILSFTTAYAISKQFKNPWVKTGLWALGLITPVSRMWEGAHWSSDIGVGVIISVITVESIDKYLNRERNYDPYLAKKKISWNLNFSRQTIGLVGTF